MLPVRVFFEKKGCAAYISHLDVQRAVIRALLRSGCRPAFTEGFNPHIKLAFAMPLSLFQESTYEIFDFSVLNDGITYEEILLRLRDVFPDELRPYAVSAPIKKLSSLKEASYDVFVNVSADSTLSDDNFLLTDDMKVMKKGKNGITEVNIRPLIHSFTVDDDDGQLILHVKCDCGSQSHLNVAYLCEWFGLRPEDYKVVRTGLYDGDGELLK